MAEERQVKMYRGGAEGARRGRRTGDGWSR